MRIGLIGNSHTGCLVAAWKDLRTSFKGVNIGAHVHRTYGTLPLIIKGGSLAGSIAFDEIQCSQRNEVLVDEYDCFYVCGLGYSLDTLGRIYEKFRCYDQHQKPGAYLLSQAAYAATVQDCFHESVVRRLLTVLRGVTDKPIACLQQPYPLEWVTTREMPKGNYFREMSAKGDWSSNLRWHELMLVQLEEAGYPVIRQPVETLKEPGLTLSEFGRADSADTSPDSPYSQHDYFHMNKAYGELVLRQLLEHALSSTKK
jgi:hypothetical protein